MKTRRSLLLSALALAVPASAFPAVPEKRIYRITSKLTVSGRTIEKGVLTAHVEAFFTVQGNNGFRASGDDVSTLAEAIKKDAAGSPAEIILTYV